MPNKENKSPEYNFLNMVRLAFTPVRYKKKDFVSRQYLAFNLVNCDLPFRTVKKFKGSSELYTAKSINSICIRYCATRIKFM